MNSLPFCLWSRSDCVFCVQCGNRIYWITDLSLLITSDFSPKQIENVWELTVSDHLYWWAALCLGKWQQIAVKSHETPFVMMAKMHFSGLYLCLKCDCLHLAPHPTHPPYPHSCHFAMLLVLYFRFQLHVLFVPYSDVVTAVAVLFQYSICTVYLETDDLKSWLRFFCLIVCHRWLVFCYWFKLTAHLKPVSNVSTGA